MDWESKERVQLEELMKQPKDNISRWAIHLVNTLDKSELDLIFKLIKKVDKYQDS